MSASGIQQMVRKLGRRCGIAVHPHLLRHTFAISYLRNGGDVFSLQYGLGHSRLDIVKLYLGSLGYEDLARVHEGASPVDNLGVRVANAEISQARGRPKRATNMLTCKS